MLFERKKLKRSTQTSKEEPFKIKDVVLNINDKEIEYFLGNRVKRKRNEIQKDKEKKSQAKDQIKRISER